MKHPSRIMESMLLSGLFLFVLTSMSGVSIIESASLSLLLTIQVSGGAALWYTVNDFQPMEIPESIGMGLALGTSITTLSQFLLRETVILNYTWAIPLIFLIPLMKHSENNSNSEIQTMDLNNKSNEKFLLTTLFALVVLAMASLWWWLYPMCVAMLMVSIIGYRTSKNQKSLGLINFACLIISISGFTTSLILGHKNDFWKVLSNDQVFSESLSWSLFKWGSNDSPFVAGTPISYHWFVLLWSGISSSASNAQSWVVITRVLPIVSFLGIFCLIWKITKDIYVNNSAPIISILFLIFYSNNFTLSFTRAMMSVTFLFSCVWLLAFANSIITFFRKPSFKIVILSSFLLFMTFGGKVMNGAIGMSAMLFALSIWFFTAKSKPYRLKIFLMAVFSIVSLIMIYVVMYSTNQPGNLNSLILRSLIPIQLGLLPPEKDGIYLFLANGFVFVSMMLPSIAVVIYSSARKSREKFEVWLVVGSIISGLILSFMTTHPGVSQLYFWLSSLVFIALMIPAIFYNVVTTNFRLILLLPSGLVAFTAAFTSLRIWNSSNLAQAGFDALRLKVIALLVGHLIVLVLITVLHLATKNRTNLQTRYIYVLLLCSCVMLNMGIGASQQFTNLIVRSKIEMSNPNDPDLMTGSVEHLQILNWMRLNTDESDVVATNRFCIPGVGYCISKWQLVSAVSHRRMLFEGGYFEIPNIPDLELNSRYKLSSDFGLAPSPIGLKHLCNYGVKWYFFDHSVANPLESWEPYASIKLQNAAVSLLMLRCPTK